MTKTELTTIWVTWMPSNKMVRVASVEAGKALIRQSYPNALLGQWQEAPFNSCNLPAWPGSGAQLRFELGDTSDHNRPMAYVYATGLDIHLDAREETA